MDVTIFDVDVDGFTDVWRTATVGTDNDILFTVWGINNAVYVCVDTELFKPHEQPRVPGRIIAISSADRPLKGIGHLLQAVAKLRGEHEVELQLVAKLEPNGPTEKLIAEDVDVTGDKKALYEVITERALEFLESRPADKPFFLMLHHKAPHRPWEPDEVHRKQFEQRCKLLLHPGQRELGLVVRFRNNVKGGFVPCN